MVKSRTILEFESEVKKKEFDLDFASGRIRSMDPSQIMMIGYEGDNLYEDGKNTKVPRIPFDATSSHPVEGILQFLKLAKSIGIGHITISAKTDAPIKLSFIPDPEKLLGSDRTNKIDRMQKGNIKSIFMFVAPRVENV